MRFVKVRIDLLDDEGHALNTETTYAVGDEGIKHGDSTVFTATISSVSGAKRIVADVYDYMY